MYMEGIMYKLGICVFSKMDHSPINQTTYDDHNNAVI